MMLTDLASTLRDAGLRVDEIHGWRQRGHGQMSGVRGVLWHHTATASTSGNFPTQNVVVNGRTGLPGPLANLGLGRDGTWYVVAAGLAYHAGSGSYPGIGSNGNGYLIGIEAENPGTGSVPWPAAQLDSYRRGTAALLRAYGLGADRCIGHKEWTNRKIDPHPLHMPTERGHVARVMNTPTDEDLIIMGLDTRFNDWAGNEQTGRSWANHVDKRLAEIHSALFGLQKSRISGDDNTTNIVNAIMDSTAWTAQTMGMVHALTQRDSGEVDPGAVAEALKPALGDAVHTAVSESLGESNDQLAEHITDAIARRLTTTEGAN